MTRLTPSDQSGGAIAPLRGPLASAHRLLFPAAGLWALVVVAVTVWGDSRLWAATPLGMRAAWHGHEMIFGSVAAAFAGYSLTAAASWSGRAPPSGPVIALLVALWMLARAASGGVFGLAPVVVLPLGAGFLGLVTCLLLREALAGRSGRGAVQAGFALGLTGLQVAQLSGARPGDLPVLLLALLLSGVGGRMVPAFTRNRTMRATVASGVERMAGLTAAVLIGLALIVSLARPGAAAIGPALLMAATAEALRLWLWRAPVVWRDGLLAMLHLGYGWLTIGLGLMGLEALGWPLVPGSGALHALSAGAVSCLIYAVAARAVARRGRARLIAGAGSMAGFALIWAAAALRVIQGGGLAETLAPILWIIGWGLFVVTHATALRHPAPRPVFSGKKGHVRPSP